MKSLGRIYLVDDDELILSMLSRTLEREGYDVGTDSGRKDLVEKIAAWHPDVVLPRVKNYLQRKKKLKS